MRSDCVRMSNEFYKICSELGCPGVCIPVSWSLRIW